MVLAASLAAPDLIDSLAALIRAWALWLMTPTRRPPVEQHLVQRIQAARALGLVDGALGFKLETLRRARNRIHPGAPGDPVGKVQAKIAAEAVGSLAGLLERRAAA